MMEHPGAFTDLNVRTSERLKAVLALCLLLSGVGAIAGIVPIWWPVAFVAAALLANWRLMAVFVRAGG